MPLSKEQKAYWLQILEKTGGNRTEMLSEAEDAEKYNNWLEKTERKEITLSLPDMPVPVRVMLTSAGAREKDSCVHVNFHGGGFVFPQNRDDDLYCAHIASETGGVVVDVDYALSPDYPFPTAFEQCYAVTRWAVSKCGEWGCSEKKVSVGGQSAGGALAAAVALRAGESGDFPLDMVILGYAALDFATPAANKPDSRSSSDAALQRSEALNALYAGGNCYAMRMPFASPVFATDAMLKKMPEAVFITGGRCPFRFEDEAFAKRMAACGVPVTVKRYINSRHGFMVRRLDEWEKAQDMVIRSIQRGSVREV